MESLFSQTVAQLGIGRNGGIFPQAANNYDEEG